MTLARDILRAIGWKPGGGKVKRLKNAAALGDASASTMRDDAIENPTAYAAAIKRRELFEIRDSRSPVHAGDWLVRAGYRIASPDERARAMRELRIPARQRGDFLRICAAWLDQEDTR